MPSERLSVRAWTRTVAILPLGRQLGFSAEAEPAGSTRSAPWGTDTLDLNRGGGLSVGAVHLSDTAHVWRALGGVHRRRALEGMALCTHSHGDPMTGA